MKELTAPHLPYVGLAVNASRNEAFAVVGEGLVQDSAFVQRGPRPSKGNDGA